MADALQEIALIAPVGRHAPGASQIRNSLVVRSQRRSALCRSSKRDPRLRCHGLRFRSLRRCEKRIDVVRCEDADLLLAERLEMACGGEVAQAAVLLRECRVGDLANERLCEAPLPSFRRSWICVEGDDFATGQGPKTSLDDARRFAVQS